MSTASPLPWLEAGQAFPPVHQAWDAASPAPGLLAVGANLDPATLTQAYAQGIFPWFSEGQPTLWWSPDPRMVLKVADFRVHASFKKTLRRFAQNPACQIRVDTAFREVMQACANSPREGQNGTWILPEMVDAYCELHAQGKAHSVETWVNGELKGGLYCVGLGRAVFGESMFSRANDASKIALAALVCLCRHHGVTQIDCQQNTGHLHSLGAREMQRSEFLEHVRRKLLEPNFHWSFEPLYWAHLLPVLPGNS